MISCYRRLAFRHVDFAVRKPWNRTDHGSRESLPISYLLATHLATLCPRFWVVCSKYWPSFAFEFTSYSPIRYPPRDIFAWSKVAFARVLSKAEGAWLDLKSKLDQLASIHGLSVPSRAARSPLEYAFTLLCYVRS